MGGGVTKLDTKYEKERSKLRRALILSFIDDEANQDIVGQIEALKVNSVLPRIHFPNFLSNSLLLQNIPTYAQLQPGN